MSEPTYDVRLLPGADAVLDAVAGGALTGPGPYRLQLQAERLLLVAGFDELICLDNLNFVPFGYQVKTAQTALRRFRGRGLLCDEVGLGKTIEAGLVLKEYLLRQLVSRVLILTPPALVEQWREELAYKFRLDDFVTTSDSEFRALGPQAWATFPHVVASLASTLRRAAREGELQAIKLRRTWFTTREAVDAMFKKRQADWLNKQRREEKGAKIRAGWQCARCREVKKEWDLTIYYKDLDDTNYSSDNMLVLCYLCSTYVKRHYHPQQMTLPTLDLPDWLR